ncbi:MAG TPA: hypothetical protein VEJ43_16015 [Pseudolabrys sp.]|nr:hypothetical protein [Pseudolabrys sp.]
MKSKIMAALIAATMLTAPAFAASVVSSPNAPAAQMVTPNKVTKASDTGVKKHRVHARASHGHKTRHAKHVKSKQVKNDSKNRTSGSKKENPKTAGTAASAKAPIKN